MIDFFPSAKDNGPITWWGRLPVYATTLLVIAHFAAFVFVALAPPLGYAGFISHLVFSTDGILEQYQIWQLFTYAFVSQVSFWFLIELAMLYFFGQEVEKFLGRELFLKLYLLLILAPSIFLTVTGVFGQSSVLAGSSILHFCLFIAFAAIVPGALLFFSIPAKWFAVGFFVFQTLVLLSSMNWTMLSVLWLSVACTLLFLRACGVRSLQFGLPAMGFPLRRERRMHSSREVPSSKPQKSPQAPARKPKKDPIESIDPILEKISVSGLGSLTEAERHRLEKARAALMNREDDR